MTTLKGLKSQLSDYYRAVSEAQGKIGLILAGLREVKLRKDKIVLLPLPPAVSFSVLLGF